MTRRAAFRAQALEALGRLEEAQQAAAEAVRWARKEPGQPGLQAVRALQAGVLAQVGARLAAEKARKDDLALLERHDQVLADQPDGTALLIRKANAQVDVGRLDLAAASASIVWNAPGVSPRDRVLAALTLARCAQPEHWILLAHREADRADDQNLLTAVAKAARASGVILPLLPGTV